MKPAIYQPRFPAPGMLFLRFPSFLILMLLTLNALGQRSEKDGDFIRTLGCTNEGIEITENLRYGGS